MAGRFGPNVMASLALLVLGLCAWCVLLGGAAGLQHNGAAVASVLNASKGTAITGDLTYTTTSRHFISYEWFKAVLQAVVLLFALGVIASGQFHRFRIAICCLLAVTTVLFCDACQTFYYLRRQTDAAEKAGMIPRHIAMQVRTYWAGCIMTAAINLALIVTIGSGLSEARHHIDAHSTTVGGKPYRSDTAGIEHPVGGHSTVV
ncbi:hypothetical protein ABBQ32_011607 [Trebouxia sp. C0010 RCD-2024]